MKAFIMAVGLMGVITLAAAASVGLVETSARDAFTTHQNVRL